MAINIGRRQFLSALGGTVVAWPIVARAQRPALPVVGILSGLSPDYIASRMPSFRKGLQEAGFIEGQNVAIEYRLAEGHVDRLPRLTADLIDRQIAVIFALGIDPAKVAKAATTTLPIVFLSDFDPVNAGLVTSLNRPGGNITGVSLLGTALEAKRLGLLHELIPGTTPIGVLLDPGFSDVDLQLRELEDAASAIKRQIIVERVSNGAEIDAAFATVARHGVSALLIPQWPSSGNFINQLTALAVGYKLPTMYPEREFAEAGGFVSYEADFADGYRQAGIYVGKIQKGAQPAELPVTQPTKFELVINLKTAKALGIEVSPSVLSIADEVIE